MCSDVITHIHLKSLLLLFIVLPQIVAPKISHAFIKTCINSSLNKKLCNSFCFINVLCVRSCWLELHENSPTRPNLHLLPNTLIKAERNSSLTNDMLFLTHSLAQKSQNLYSLSDESLSACFTSASHFLSLSSSS